ncbi:MAG: hypothetical protein OEW31_07115 [Thermoleophilia bacterium]|nr:hypothetical protein [Thermoleophilia bacterium]MDH4346086.1 hypothetical protein [Thermoleophilia bacterium]
MRRRVVRAIEVALLPTAGLAVALAILPDRAELATHLWLLTMVTIALAVAVATLRSAYPSAPSSFDTAPGGSPRATGIEGLDRAEREIGLSMSSAFDAHLRLRPALRELAGGLLASRRGVDLERRPERARELLGAELWDVLGPEREAPVRRHDGGLTADEIDRMLRVLEEL